MSMIAITGLQGAGKGHQTMKYFIIPNYAGGRIIKTNLKGIKEPELIEYCKKEYPKVDPSTFGKIIPITDLDIKKTNFFPTLEEVDNKEVPNDKDSIIKSGDVVIIDEAAQFYSTLSKEALIYFTMHRHFTDANGLSSEICLQVQNLKLLNTKVKAILKNTYHCKKLDFMGRDNKYFLGIYDGGTTAKASMINSKSEPYDPEMFKLYESHAAGTGKERKLDKRANIFNNPKAWILISAVVIAPIFLVWTLWRFIHPEETEIKAVTENGKSSLSSVPVNNSNSNSNSFNSTEPTYKIVGVIDFKGKRQILLQDQFKGMKTIYPSSCLGTGLFMTCKYDNKEISFNGQKYEIKNNNLPPVVSNALQ